MKHKIFISHANKDKDIVAEFNRLLATGLDITGEKVFCSSLPGRKVEGGFDFVERIKKAFEVSEIIILILTKNYFDSRFCLAELGACWISDKVFIPILVPPVDYNELKATLSIRNSWVINSPNDLSSLADDIANNLNIKPKMAQFESERDVFLDKLEHLIKNQKLPETVSPEDLSKCESKLAYVTDKVKSLEIALNEKDRVIEKLKSLKDAKEVDHIFLSEMSEMEQFNKLCNDVKLSMKTISSIEIKAIYYFMKGENLPIPESFDRSSWDAIGSAIDKKFLFYQEGEPITLNVAHPKISKVINSLKELKDFMSDSSGQFQNKIEQKYEFTFDTDDIEFWNKFFDSRFDY